MLAAGFAAYPSLQWRFSGRSRCGAPFLSNLTVQPAGHSSLFLTTTAAPFADGETMRKIATTSRMLSLVRRGLHALPLSPHGGKNLRFLSVVASSAAADDDRHSTIPSKTMKHATICLLISLTLLAGCAGPPIGAERVSARASYAQIEKNVLSGGKPSSYTAAVLHRYDLGGLAVYQPDKAVSELYNRTLATGDRELLFALAETSYLAAEEINRSLKPWDQRDAREYYLGAAVYAYLYLFGDSKDPRPSPFDGRFRTACDLYNYGLGWALTERESTNVVVHLEGGKRKLPVGEIELS